MRHILRRAACARRVKAHPHVGKEQVMPKPKKLTRGNLNSLGREAMRGQGNYFGRLATSLRSRAEEYDHRAQAFLLGDETS